MLSLKKRNFLFLLIGAMVIGALVMGLFSLGMNFLTNQIRLTRSEYNEYQTLKKNYGELATLQKLIEEKYYEPVKKQDLITGAYRGLFWGIGDPYSSYLTKEDYKQLQESTKGEYQGIGVTLEPDAQGYVNIIAPIDGSPAEKAGIQAGDKVLAVDGKNYNADSIDGAVNAMRGQPGTKVELLLLRGDKEIELEVVRATITLETVKSEMLPSGIGYIRISAFEEKTADDFKNVLRNMETSGAKGLIIDLRDNPGGLVDASIEVADLLLPEGVVTYTEDRKGEKTFYRSKPGATDLPYVLLVNNSSASASEIVAGAVKDFNAGELVGTTTYGKGIIQEIVPLGNGGATKLTVMQYFSPEGNVIHKVGVEPDYVVEATKTPGGAKPSFDQDAQLIKAEELLK
ncbi:MAG TPA: S41 family peptidase [Clostridiales bacterium]|jgi:carboxyl-terminal processing protease|nr:S41 family peptidase [Clostridiales bacterium]